ncbi:MAG: isocitrate/isopropylmalate family dehydrogenase [Proteobacteria bacterium]|nr:isocitrate/isopropylmalate family dehydrogenase [Pseudomonadota bacterium]
MNEPLFSVAVIRGDGIGVDVTDATLAIVDAARDRVGGFRLDYRNLDGGAGYFRETGKDMAPGAEKAAGEADAISPARKSAARSASGCAAATAR